MTEEQLTYEEWLEKADLEDNEENKSWYECPEDERSTWLENHPDY